MYPLKHSVKLQFVALVWAVALLLALSACGEALTTQARALDTPTPTNSLTPTPSATPANLPSCDQQTTIRPSSTPSDQASAYLNTNRSLATGRVDQLPGEALFMHVLEVSQPAGDTITHQHVAGIVYVANGSQTLTMANDNTAKTLNANDAAFIGEDVLHSHANPGTSANRWLYFSVRRSSQHEATKIFPNQKEIFASPDLPTPPPGPYCENLRLIEQQAGGREAAHIYNGAEAIVVLDGSLKVTIAGQQPTTLQANQGIYNAPGTPMQEFNAGSGNVRFLDYILWPQGQPFRADLTQSQSESPPPAPSSSPTPPSFPTPIPTPIPSAPSLPPATTPLP